MKKILLWLILLILCSCSDYKGDKDSLEYDKVRIVFDGYGDFETESKFTIEITDPVVIDNLNQLKTNSKINLFAELKATEYSIRLYFENSDTDEKLLMNISKSKGRTATIEYGAGTIFDGKYQNPELIQYLSQILKLDEIKAHKGKLTQAGYDNLILKDQ